MGQLEKYGLYVLCLVIFLILGVTIWGPGPDLPAKRVVADAGVNGPGLNSLSATLGPSEVKNGTPTGSLRELLGGDDKPAKKPVTPSPTGSSTDQPPEANGGPQENTPPAKVPDQPGHTDEPAKGDRPTHKVRAGDNFERIAREELGNPALQTLIVQLNPRIDPRKLQIGQSVLLPTAAEIAQAKPAVAPAADKRSDKATPQAAIAANLATRNYKVASGDTLEGIARRELGSIRRVDEVKELNPTVNPRNLRIGQQILLPKK